MDPPASVDNFYRARICPVDADGNEIAGIRLPSIAFPLGTYTGWNVYRAQVRVVAALLIAARLLLPSDADSYVRSAKSCDSF